MTKQVGVLTPPQNPSGLSGKDACKNCDRIRQQAEDAFSELRNQTDKHIHAVQKKLREDHSMEVSRLRGQIETLQTELKRVKNLSDTRTTIQRLNEDFEKRAADLRKEYDSRISVLQANLDEAEVRIAQQKEDSLRSARRDNLLRDARVKDLEKENETAAREVDRLEIENQSLKAKLDKSKLDQEVAVEKHTKLISSERDDARERLGLAEDRIASLEAFKREAEIERARSDLHYRRRLGDMESEVRKTEIESVRLRREIIQLTQKLEQSEGNSSSQVSSFPMLTSARSRLFAIEAGTSKLQIGRITRVGQDRSPKKSPKAVEELPPPTPSSDDSN